MDFYRFEVNIENHSLISAFYHYSLQHFFNFFLYPHNFLFCNVDSGAIGVVDVDVEEGLELGMLAIKIWPVDWAYDFVGFTFVACLEVLGGERIECERWRKQIFALDIHIVIEVVELNLKIINKSQKLNIVINLKTQL